MMQVCIQNDGPVTLEIESPRQTKESNGDAWNRMNERCSYLFIIYIDRAYVLYPLLSHDSKMSNKIENVMGA